MIDDRGHKTVQRWSSEFEEHGGGERGPRLFDGIKHAQTYSHDYTPLDHFSSFELIRKNSMKTEHERQKKMQQEHERALEKTSPKMSKMTSEHSYMDSNGVGQSSPNHDPNASMRSLGSSRASSRVASVPVSRGHIVRSDALKVPELKDLDKLKQKGDDVSMMDRLASSARKEPSKPTTPRSQQGDKPVETRRRKSQKDETSPRKKSRELTKEMTETKELQAIDEGTPARMIVRSGGFQWIDKQARGDVLSQVTEDMQTPMTEMSRASLHRSGTDTKSTGRASPPRSASRNRQTPSSRTPRPGQA